MSAFSPLGQKSFNPITTPLHHNEQTGGREFEPFREVVSVVTTNVPVTDRTHFQPIVKTNNSNTSPVILEPPATRRRFEVSFPDI
tara:strand:- start:283 stop:537 length:255 start_codon:yes stop_codon:yes gene_type:complete